MKYTKDMFMNNIKDVREVLMSHTDEELFEEKVMEDKTKVIQRLKDNKDYSLDMFRYHCNCIGEYAGNHIFLYDNDGEGIRNNNHLNDVLSKWKVVYEDRGEPNPYKDLKVYVIPADVHH